MKKLLVFIGESGSGKTTLIAEIVRQYPDQYKKIITCTNRPKRPGEVDGIDYNFLPDEYFISNPNLVLAKKSPEGFCYGTRKSDLFPTTHNLLLTSKLTGIPKLIDLGCQNIIVVHLHISNQLKIERMRNRGDTEEMIMSRLEIDAKSNLTVDLRGTPIINLDAAQKKEEKIEVILRCVND